MPGRLLSVQPSSKRHTGLGQMCIPGLLLLVRLSFKRHTVCMSASMSRTATWARRANLSEYSFTSALQTRLVSNETHVVPVSWFSACLDCNGVQKAISGRHAAPAMEEDDEELEHA